MTRTEVLAKISTDLAWRGPGDRSLRYVVIERADAGTLLDPTEPSGLLTEIYRLTLLFNAAMPEGERAPAPASAPAPAPAPRPAP